MVRFGTEAYRLLDACYPFFIKLSVLILTDQFAKHTGLLSSGVVSFSSLHFWKGCCILFNVVAARINIQFKVKYGTFTDCGLWYRVRNISNF